MDFYLYINQMHAGSERQIQIAKLRQKITHKTKYYPHFNVQTLYQLQYYSYLKTNFLNTFLFFIKLRHFTPALYM